MGDRTQERVGLDRPAMFPSNSRASSRGMDLCPRQSDENRGVGRRSVVEDRPTSSLACRPCHRGDTLWSDNDSPVRHTLEPASTLRSLCPENPTSRRRTAGSRRSGEQVGIVEELSSGQRLGPLRRRSFEEALKESNLRASPCLRVCPGPGMGLALVISHPGLDRRLDVIDRCRVY